MKPDEILSLLTGADDADLFARAHDTRHHTFGDTVWLQAVVAVSNSCAGQCEYCDLRADNRSLPRYRLSATDVLDATGRAVAEGAGTVILQSGTDPGLSMEWIGELVREIKARHDVAVALELGDRGLDEYAFWRECGADRCLLKLETADRNRYKRLHGEDPTSRLHRLECLRRMGYETGSGVIVGLPGTTPIDTLRDILLLSELDLDFIETGPFTPLAGTPLAGNPPGSIILSQRAAALLRLLNPLANIPAARSLDALRPGACAESLARGCNALAADMTPAVSGRPVRPAAMPDILDDWPSLAPARRAIVARGFVPSAAKGFSPRRDHVR